MTESVSECDFCTAKVPHLYPINDGLWAICKVCMDIYYTVLPAIEERKKVEVKLCGHGVPFADCGCEEE